MAGEDTEITLGAGKLLGLFFMLVAICGVFFAIGYSLGKTSAREQALNDRAAETNTVATTSEGAANKPSAGLASKPISASPATADDTASKEVEPDLTFYKAVKQNGQDPSSQKPTAAGNATPGTTETVAKNSPAPSVREAKSSIADGSSTASASVVAPKPSTGTELATPATSATGTYLVQIAAVSHEEDAAALAGALRKKNYTATVVNNPEAKDKLYHVVIGPFASLQDAETMKLKLRSEGYTPIVKR